MDEITIDDPAFGPLVWDGLCHHGWGGSFTDAEFLAWGHVLTEVFDALDDEEDEDSFDGPKTSNQDFLDELLTAGRVSLPQDEESIKILQMARDLARRADAYDGVLDAEPLRKAGRLKVVVRNGKDEPPTPQQQAAWETFRGRGEAMAEEIAQALLKVYTAQRPERLRWFEAIYPDDPSGMLPDVRTPRQTRSIVRPKEFRVYLPDLHGVAVGVVLENFWAEGEIEVEIRGGNVVAIKPHESDGGVTGGKLVEEIDVPGFGRLRRHEYDHEWRGTYHSEALRGFLQASETRYHYKRKPEDYSITPERPGPSWDSVTGDHELCVFVNKDERPTPEQAEAYARFRDDPKVPDLILRAIFDYYRKFRPEWIEQMNGSKAERAAIMPDLKSPEGMLEIVSLRSVHVMQAPTEEETREGRVIQLPFGPDRGRLISVPQKKPGVSIVLHFSWFDEHGLGVRWRNGVIEHVGDWDSVVD